MLLNGVVSCAGALVSTENQSPNILMIAIDDQNDRIRWLDGHPQVQTPHINVLTERCF